MRDQSTTGGSRRVTAMCRFTWRRLAIAAAAVVLAFLFGTGGEASQAVSTQLDGNLGPADHTGGSYIAALRRAQRALEDAEDEVLALGEEHSASLLVVELLLKDTQDQIAYLLPETAEPSGSVRGDVNPVTAIEHAAICRSLAVEAVAEAEAAGPSLNTELVGSNLRTIESLLPSYRTAVGL